MARAHKSRSGSLQFWPRKRAKRQYPRINSWADIDATKLLGFMGYKAGMVHVQYSERNPLGKGDILKMTAATIIECPSIKPYSLRFYKKNPYGSVVVSEILSKKVDKELARKINLSKKPKIEKKVPDKFDEVRLVAYTQPVLTNLPKKKPELMEIKISKGDVAYAQSLLEKEIDVEDIFKEGNYVDTHAVTTGRGRQGPVRRFGVALKQKKSEKGTRRPGSLGNWNAVTMMWTVAQSGQTGYHTRTEYNKLIIKVCSPEEVNNDRGYRGYGIVKNKCILIKGSIPGPKKRLIRFTFPIRKTKDHHMELKEIIKA